MDAQRPTDSGLGDGARIDDPLRHDAGLGEPAGSPRVDVAARLFHGLGDPTRLSILLALLDGERRVTDLAETVGSSQPNVSNHLACLRECGLVVARPAERRQVFYSIAHPELRDVLLAAERLLARAGQQVVLCARPEMDRAAPARG
jgi:ArsR family transcriptional regulator, cadmium/lead-responsive transcriptional repressor